MFLTLFKPKWQHSNPDVRVQAIEKLRPEQADHQNILFKLMTEDPSANVRSAASKRTDDLASLIQLLGQIQNSQDKHTQTLEQRIVELLNQNPDQQRALAMMLEALGTTESLKLFAQSKHTMLIESQLDQLDEPVLLELALSALPLNLRKEAASKIHSPQLVEQLVKESRNRDKSIFKQAKDKQQAQKEAVKQHAELINRANELIDQMTQLAQGEWFPLYDARFEVIEKAWALLDLDQLDEDQIQAFTKAQATTQERITLKAEAQALAAKQKAEYERALLEAGNLLQDVNAQLAPLEDEWLTLFDSRELDTARLSNVQQVINILFQQLDQWPTHLNDASLTKQGERLRHQLETTKATWVNASALHADIVQTIATLEQTEKAPKADELQAAKRHLKSFDTTSQELPVLVKQLSDLISGFQEQQKAAQLSQQRNQQQFTQLMDDLEKAIEQGEARKADKCMRKLERTENEQRRLPNALQTRLKNLTAKLQELKDWQGFAVQPKKEELCEEMEALITSDVEPQEKSNAIKLLQAQWKALDLTDPVHSSKLWNRFKTASDQAYAPCEQFFEQQRQARRYNLEQRQLIVNELTQYLNAIDWETIYWRDVETVLNTAKKEWKQYVPVDRGPGQKVQSTFNDLIVSTESHFKAIKEESLNKKQALIEQARLLAESADPIAAATGAKELQADWKLAGPTFHSQERKLWMAFRAACDTIFERLSEQQQKDRQRSRLNLSSISDRLYHALHHPTPIAEIIAPMAEGKAMIESNADAIKERERSHFMKLNAQAEQMISTLEAELNSDQAHAAAIEPIRLAEDQWLEANAINLDEFETLKAALATNQLPIIQARFNAWLDDAGEYLAPNDQVKKAQRALREIAIELEIMLGLSSPEEDQPLRMEMQMLRLQQVLEQSTPKHTNASLIEQYQLRLSIPLAQQYPDLLTRIDQLVADYMPMHS